jgi:hypothetical protein
MEAYPERAMYINPQKCGNLNHIYFIIAAQKVFTCTEAARGAFDQRRHNNGAGIFRHNHSQIATLS